MTFAAADSPIQTCVRLTAAISGARDVEEIYDAALDALGSGLGVARASILLFDPDGVMRFKAYRRLSEEYRRAVEGHTPWRPDSPNPQPIVVRDVRDDASLASYLPVFEAEGIAAMAFIPLVSLGRVIGKFMLYYAVPTELGADDIQLATVIASQVAFAVERTRTEQQARRSEERLRFALDAALMGTWDWDLTTNEVQWSDNLASIHGLPANAFDGTFASYEKEIHPDDRPRVYASIERALKEGVAHDVEYRLVAPDGTVRWCEGKGRVDYENGRPVRMSGVCVIVTRRKEAELARLAAAEESSRLKDEFLATLSHELRTPLNAILGWVQMLQTGELSAARARQAVDVIGRNARLQAQLIEDILDVSRIITGKLEIERQPVSVSQLLETVAAGIAPEVAAKGLVFHSEIAATLPPIEGDAKRLYQVLNNVLSNAVKFTDAGGTIRLRCVADERRLRIEIRDSGIGIAPEFLPHVFDRFRQADSRSTRVHGGLGLGLAIAKHLVELHDGVIDANSEGPGTGTLVSIDLPAAAGLNSDVEADSPLAAAAFQLANATLLVVDDQADSREMIAALLEQRGATILQCDSTQAALDVLATKKVDLLIADIAMPHVDGYELMRRAKRSGCVVPGIAVTAFAHADDRRRALESGYTSYLAKPVDGLELARTVHDLLARSAPRAVDRQAR
ncbi:MAG TPA: ATP-binding protein [Vicinamibacterales bacterium]|jgi:PAS domain S-box-containing protein